jgi:lipopolysaccharide transport system permease protein
MDSPSPIRVYSAESSAFHVGEVVRSMVSGMLKSRYVAYRLVLKDIKESYSGSVLGFVWDLLDPLILAGIFYYLMQTRLISAEGLGMPASVFVVYGMMLYQTYTESITLSMDLMNRSKNLLNHLNIAPEALVISVACRVGFNSLFRIGVMLVFSIMAGVFSPIGFLKFIVLFPLMIIWGMAPGLLLAPFNTIYKDVGRIVRLIIVPLRFLAPVIYAIPAGTMLDKLQVINPVTMILVNLRSLAVNNSFIDVPMLLLHGGVVLVVGLVGWFLFHISIPILSERS